MTPSRKNHKLLFSSLLLLMMVFLMASCGSARTSSTKSSGTTLTGSTSATHSGYEGKFESLLATYGSWTDAKIPLTLSLASPANVSISGTVTMKKDENIHISLKFFGMEVAQLYVTGDSIFASYKMNKVYVAEPLSSLLNNFPVTVGNVQDLLLGRVFVLGKGTLTADDIASLTFLRGSRKGYFVQPNGVDGMDYRFNINADDCLAHLIVAPEKSKEVMCNYQSPVNTSVGTVAPSVGVKANAGSKLLDVTFEWNLSRAKFNTGEVRSWSVPKGYTRVKGADILKMLSSM